jgi:hypothetical protein
MSCPAVVERFLADEDEAPLVVMELERECDEGRADACLAFARFLVEGADVSHEPTRAIELFDQGCRNDDLDACYRLGKVVAHGSPGPGDGRAVRALRRACDDERPDACFVLAELVRHGRSGNGGGRDAQEAEAVPMYRQACEAGNTQSCRRVADHYVGRDDRAALVSLYDSMCSARQPHGCTLLAELYGRSDDAAELSRVGPLLERACADEDPGGCAALGRALMRGSFGIAPDAGRAKELLEAGCQAEDWASCAELGRLHEEGVGVRRNTQQARDLYERACNRRSGVACYRLGLAHREAMGRGDLERAVQLFRTACESGESERGCGSLAAAYDMGRGVTQDRAEAIPLYHRACDAGHPDSCVRLAALVEEGDGAAADHSSAALYRQRACTLRPFDDLCPQRSVEARSFRGRVAERTGRRAPPRGATCAVTITRVVDPHWCWLRIRCGGRDVYGRDGGWAECEVGATGLKARDWHSTPFDGTPTLDIDTHDATGRVADVVGEHPMSFVLDL